MIKPTVGRVVYFRPQATDDDIASSADQPLAAIIAHVLSDRRVNLCVIDMTGHSHSRTNVRLLQDDDDPVPGERHAFWMPYQKGQAAKNDNELGELKARVEALEAAVEAKAEGAAAGAADGTDANGSPVA